MNSYIIDNVVLATWEFDPKPSVWFNEPRWKKKNSFKRTFTHMKEIASQVKHLQLKLIFSDTKIFYNVTNF